MEVNGVCQFLTDHGYNAVIFRELRPPRIVIDQQLSICVCDGDLYLENFKKIPNACGYKPVARIPLAHRDSFDLLLEAIRAWNNVGEGPGLPRGPTDAG